MALPILDAQGLDLLGDSFGHHCKSDSLRESGQTRAEWKTFCTDLTRTLESGSMFQLINHGIEPDFLELVLAQTASFFAQSDEAKDEINSKKSTNHRGYGLLKNYRDWREQIHIGVEAETCNKNQDSQIGTDSFSLSDSGDWPEYWSLWGPNQWPQSENNIFKKTMLAYIDRIDKLSRNLLFAIALSIQKEEDFFTVRMKDRPYLLVKAMSYLPQEKLAVETQEMQSGVTAHCDWSWLTLLIQDQVGGLEAADKKGTWQKVDPIPGAIIINTGELLEIESGGRFNAVPHRVINSSILKQRYSVPLFINPALDSNIYPTGIFDRNHRENEKCNTEIADAEEHVHKVVKPGRRLNPFVFGESEWQRKEQGLWCHDELCCRPAAST